MIRFMFFLSMRNYATRIDTWLMDDRDIVCRVLILAKGTAVQKSFIVPLFALQAPASVVSWIKYVARSHFVFYWLVYMVNCYFSTKICSVFSSYQHLKKNWSVFLTLIANWTYRGRYGVWTAFVALLIRLFFYIPGMFSYSSCVIKEILKERRFMMLGYNPCMGYYVYPYGNILIFKIT